ncbi:halomucin [Plakobranchus ocellatus]|uniref:Halomucin n=1 Tax=Plakobranchus ocellatus TaxID=259542 RepID=A0AAV3ZJA3_9GAST|nr:halomucin [Plakobranchus ocellatus]
MCRFKISNKDVIHMHLVRARPELKFCGENERRGGNKSRMDDDDDDDDAGDDDADADDDGDDADAVDDGEDADADGDDADAVDDGDGDDAVDDGDDAVDDGDDDVETLTLSLLLHKLLVSYFTLLLQKSKIKFPRLTKSNSRVKKIQ